MNIQKGVLERNWGGGWVRLLPQTLLGAKGTQGPFNAKLMGMLGVGGGKGSALGRFDSERVGLGGVSPAMQNGWGSGARGAKVVKSMGVGLCSGVGHINVTLRYKQTTQFHSSANPQLERLSSHRCPLQLLPDFLCYTLELV